MEDGREGRTAGDAMDFVLDVEVDHRDEAEPEPIPPIVSASHRQRSIAYTHADALNNLGMRISNLHAHTCSQTDVPPPPRPPARSIQPRPHPRQIRDNIQNHQKVVR